MQRRIVAIEGCDGSGKTTVAKELAKAINGATYIHFPTKTNQYGILLHRYISGEYTLAPSEVVDSFLLDMRLGIVMMARDDRSRVVIADRYLHSTLVYQQCLNNMSEAAILELAAIHGVFPPSLSIYLRAPVEVLTERIRARPDNNRFDIDRELIGRTHALYESLWKRGEMIAVDATKPLAEVVRQCVEIIEGGLKNG